MCICTVLKSIAKCQSGQENKGVRSWDQKSRGEMFSQPKITLHRGDRIVIDLDMCRRQCLLQGLDDISLTLDKADHI